MRGHSLSRATESKSLVRTPHGHLNSMSGNAVVVKWGTEGT